MLWGVLGCVRAVHAWIDRPARGSRATANRRSNRTTKYKHTHQHETGDKAVCMVDGAFANARCSLKLGQTLAQAKAAVAAEMKLEVLK